MQRAFDVVRRMQFNEAASATDSRRQADRNVFEIAQRNRADIDMHVERDR